MIRRPPRSTQSRSSAASDVYKRQAERHAEVVEHGGIVRGLALQQAEHEDALGISALLEGSGSHPERLGVLGAGRPADLEDARARDDAGLAAGPCEDGPDAPCDLRLTRGAAWRCAAFGAGQARYCLQRDSVLMAEAHWPSLSLEPPPPSASHTYQSAMPRSSAQASITRWSRLPSEMFSRQASRSWAPVPAWPLT